MEHYVAKTRLNIAKVYLCKVHRICAGTSTSTRGIRATLRLEMALGQGAVLRGSRVQRKLLNCVDVVVIS